MKLRIPSYFAIAFASSSYLYHARAASIRGASNLATTTSISDDATYSRFLISKERRLLPHEGVMRTLIIRVTDAEGKQPITDARRESDTWFGTYDLALAGNLNSLTGLYEQCSGGKLSFVPATGPGVVDGVLELSVGRNMTGMQVAEAGNVVRNDFNSLNINLGIEFETFSMILPMGVSGRGGLAGKGGNHQMYAGGAERSLELVMHEFGHNLGFHHSGLPDEGEYDDNSCMMGCCAGAQQMCFNAAKSWYSGWYTEGHLQLDYLAIPGQWWKGSLVGIDDYLNEVFDNDGKPVVAKISAGLFMMFNRKKGVNAGVRAYSNEVVIVQQWGEGGKSKVLAHLNGDDKRLIEFSRDDIYTDFDMVVEVCEIYIAPIVTGPKINVTNSLATQSSTVAGAEASRAIDGNLDQTWAGGSVTHTSGDDEDLDPWWMLTLDQAEEIEHIRIFNRGDCCGSRLNDAFVELYDDDNELIWRQNLGQAENVKEVFLGGRYLAKTVKIQLVGFKVLSLAEVQLFAPGQARREPDHAEVIVSVSDGPPLVTCDTTMPPTRSLMPSPSPSTTLQPTIRKEIPKDVVLLRDDTPCIFQSNPSSHPDRFKCGIQPTTVSSEPGGYGNAPVGLQGKDGCTIAIQPVTWAWGGTALIFESFLSISEINSCFDANTLITEGSGTDIPTPAPLPPVSDSPSTAPTKAVSVAPSVAPSFAKPVIPPGVELLRDEVPCIFQSNPSNHPDRFKCMIKPTSKNIEPGTYNNNPVRLGGRNGCVIQIRPVTWAWDGNAFIFQSSESLEAVNACFAAGILLSDSGPIEAPSAAPSAVAGIPRDVQLLRDSRPCVFQSNPSNHPDRYKCTVELTTTNSEPGVYGSESVELRGRDDCTIILQPVTWAWEGYAFIFQSSESLEAINSCFAAGLLISEQEAAAEGRLFG